MDSTELRDRCRQFALDVIDVCLTLGHDDLAYVIRPQLLCAATGVASNQRASRRARSKKEFASKLAVVIEEADESELWLDILSVHQRGAAHKVSALRQEASELTAIFTKSRTTALENIKHRRGA
jgi:four helix bundle protein